MSRDQDVFFMRQAIELAQRAADYDEVPVGAVLVHDGTVIGTGFNQTISNNDCSAHAEILALRNAGQHTGQYRFPGSTLYCTLEPCAMCAGAMLHARIERLVIAADDPKAGAAGSVVDLLDDPRLNHRVVLSCGLLEDEAAGILKTFFKQRR
ncbi:MAG: tRNA adenosine(34) deaminase TadA [Gammaproteobacteria bacterium]